MSRREFLTEVENAVRTNIWEVRKPGEVNPEPTKEKYFITFPYPYMNGRLHIGHLYSMTKAEIYARFKKLQGYHVLWPFGLHCTGMPIMAAADKLKNERDGFVRDEVDSSPSQDKEIELTKSKHTSGREKTKITAKTGGLKKQSDIMRSLGIPEEEIFDFADPEKWLHYFPEHCLSDLKKVGFSGDLRRSFITTDANPYYDSFIRWQFTTLKERGYIGYGLRPTIYSPTDNQPCLDHDRASGEGAMPQEFTNIKVKINEPDEEWIKAAGGEDTKKVFNLVCSTLRPETMYGQTSVFVLPHGDYVMTYALSEKQPPSEDDTCARIKMTREEAQSKCTDIYLISERSARNMMYQGIVPMDPETKTFHHLMSVKGFDLLGRALTAPLTSAPVIYSLPMSTISMDKGTGIVTSVPSDSPDDYITVRELKNNEELRSKYKRITMEMIDIANTIIPIIEIPGIGNQSAVTVSEAMGIKNPNDKTKLTEAKAETYTKGFYEGTLIVGEFKGTPVCDCKTVVRGKLMQDGDAMIYHEPDNKVTSRSGDDCVVAQLNQWYLKYGDESWKKNVRDWIKDGLNTFNETAKQQFVGTVDWLDSWACTRNYGLGTRCPWEPDQLIESLSDSVIYYAYYTVKHLLHSDIYGNCPGELDIKSEQLTHSFWSYIFGIEKDVSEDMIKAGVSLEKAERCREEFNYWYPMDFRASAKDLIPNHLTMSLFHHEAIWPGQAHTRQNQAYFVNGHVLVDNQKMSKSLGNFITLAEAVDTYTADGVRIGCAVAGDTMTDANFERSVAENALLKLYTVVTHCQGYLTGKYPYRPAESEYTAIDKMFLAQIASNAKDGQYYFNNMKYREAMRAVYFEMLNIEGRYLVNCSADGLLPHPEIHRQWMSTFAICLSPVAPHICEHIWMNLLKNDTLVSENKWPEMEIDKSDVLKAEKLSHIIEDIKRIVERSKKGKKASQSFKSTVVYVRKEFLPWQNDVLSILRDVCVFDNEQRLSNLDEASANLRANPKLKELPKKQQGISLMFGIFHLKEEVSKYGKRALDSDMVIDEMELLIQFKTIVQLACGTDSVEFVDANEGVDHSEDRSKGKFRAESRPNKPSCFFY